MTVVLDFSGALTAKRLALLRDLVPGATLIAVLVDSASPDAENRLLRFRKAPVQWGRRSVVSAGSEHVLEAALATVVELHAGALRHRRPAVHETA